MGSFRIKYFELLIARKEILSNLSTDQEKILLEEALKKLKQCQVMKGSLFRQNSSALILSRILTLHNYNISETDQYDKDKFEIFNNFVILEDSSIINRIKYRAEEFLKIE